MYEKLVSYSIQEYLVTTQSKMVPGVGLEPTRLSATELKSVMTANSINRGLLVPCEGIEPNHLLITNQLHDLHANKALLQLLSLMNRFIKHISPATDNHEQELDSDSFSLPGCTKPTCQSFGSSALLIGLILVFRKDRMGSTSTLVAP